jgi:DtxR family Mn-dependent transcriptional regulator
VSDLIDTTEMYLKTIFELEEEGVPPLRARIAERLGHSGPTVSQTVARMERDGLVSLAGDRQLAFTEHGRRTATRVMRKHRLAERLLVDVIGLELPYVHEEACRWEHVISERVERKILGLLGGDHTSPYGNPIPGLEELGDEAPAEGFRHGLTTLVEAAHGDDAVVVVCRIGEPIQTDQETLALLADAHVLPGSEVALSLDGDRVIAVGRGLPAALGVSLPEDIAEHVFCRLAVA